MMNETIGSTHTESVPQIERERLAREEAETQIEAEIRQNNQDHDKERTDFVAKATSPGSYHPPTREVASQAWLDGERDKAQRAIENVINFAHTHPGDQWEDQVKSGTIKDILDEIIDKNLLNYYGGSELMDPPDMKPIYGLMHLRRQARIEARTQELLKES